MDYAMTRVTNQSLDQTTRAENKDIRSTLQPIKRNQKRIDSLHYDELHTDFTRV